MIGERSIPHDAALPALEALFPPQGAPPFIAEAIGDLTGRDVQPEALDVTYVRYRPGKSCVVLWSHQDKAGARPLASARLFHNQRARKLLGRDTNRDLIQRAATLNKNAGVPYRYFPEQRLLLQLFPLDLQLPQLVLAADPVWLREHLGANGSRPNADEIAATPVSYKPGRRCVYRYDVAAGGKRESYYAKLFRDDRGEELLAWHQTISSSLSASHAPWTIPTAAGYIPEARMLLFEDFAGATKVRTLLRPALKDAATKQQLLGYISAAAEGLAAFQQSPIDNLPSQSPQELVDAFRKDCAGIAAIAPDLAAEATEVLDRLQSAARAFPPEPLVPTHGAFRHDQLLHAEDRLIVLDLDTICLSGASADAGNFLGYLDLTAIRRPRLQPIINDCARTFVAAVKGAGQTSPQWVAWYRAAAHVKKGLRAFYSLKPNWPETATRLLSLSGDTLREARAA